MATGKKIFHSRPGYILHLQRENLESLALTRAAIGESSFSTQYQQNPIPVGEAMIKTDWLRYYEPEGLPEGTACRNSCFCFRVL